MVVGGGVVRESGGGEGGGGAEEVDGRKIFYLAKCGWPIFQDRV